MQMTVTAEPGVAVLVYIYLYICARLSESLLLYVCV